MEGPLESMDQACWALTGRNCMGLQHEGLKSDWTQTSRQWGHELTASWVFGCT